MQAIHLLTIAVVVGSVSAQQSCDVETVMNSLALKQFASIDSCVNDSATEMITYNVASHLECASKCLWTTGCTAFNYYWRNAASGNCTLRKPISGYKFKRSVKAIPGCNFYYRKCPEQYTNYSTSYKTYYYLYNTWQAGHVAGYYAPTFCTSMGMQLLQVRNPGELSYIWNNVFYGDTWLNAMYAQVTSYVSTTCHVPSCQTAPFWRDDGDSVDFSVAAPGGVRCGYSFGRECISTSAFYQSQYCFDSCTETYPVICTCYDYANV